MKLTEQELWKIIEKSKWKTDHDYKRISNEWKNLSKKDFKQLEKFIYKKLELLHKKFNNDWLGNPGINLGDDSWGDLLAEVVGRGEKFYNSITTNKLRKMADGDDFEECFTYCLHINLEVELTQEQLDSCERYARSFEVDDEYRKMYNTTDKEIYKSRLEFALEQHKNNNQDWPFINY